MMVCGIELDMDEMKGNGLGVHGTEESRYLFERREKQGGRKRGRREREEDQLSVCKTRGYSRNENHFTHHLFLHLIPASNFEYRYVCVRSSIHPTLGPASNLARRKKKKIEIAQSSELKEAQHTKG